MKYVHSSDGMTVDGGVRSSKPAEAGWYPCAWNVPAHGDDETCVCVGYERKEDGFKAIFNIVSLQIETTEADKDAALRRFGVEV